MEVGIWLAVRSNAFFPEVSYFLSTFDITLLQEICLSNITISPGYSTLSKEAQKGEKKGRPRGRFACLISSALNISGLEVVVSSDLNLAVLIQSTDLSFIVTSIYTPPTQNQHVLTSYLSFLLVTYNNLIHRFPNSLILITGDLNVRIGQDDECLI